MQLKGTRFYGGLMRPWGLGSIYAILPENQGFKVWIFAERIGEEMYRIQDSL